MDNSDPRINHIEAQPELSKKMRDLTLGIYETTKYMMHNNPSLVGEH